MLQSEEWDKEEIIDSREAMMLNSFTVRLTGLPATPSQLIHPAVLNIGH
jgi:hypothetical protein